jgi:hypothetical protein
MTESPHTRKRLNVLTGTAAATAIAGTLLLGGLTPTQAQESSPATDSNDSVNALLYDAKETWGVNWDGWQVAIENATGSELTFQNGSVTFKNGSGLFAKSETIAPGTTGNVVGRQDWWFGYYPDNIDATYKSGNDMNYFVKLFNGVVSPSYSGLACGIRNEDGSHAKDFVGCEVTSGARTEQIKIRFTEVKTTP